MQGAGDGPDSIIGVSMETGVIAAACVVILLLILVGRLKKEKESVSHNNPAWQYDVANAYGCDE